MLYGSHPLLQSWNATSCIQWLWNDAQHFIVEGFGELSAFERYSLINLSRKPPLAQDCNSVDWGSVDCTWNLDY
jgi:hypothetical protein